MTLFHYIGADKPLPTGSFGYKYTYQKYSDIPKSDDPNAIHNIVDLSHLNDTYVQVFETELDAAGMYITEVTSGSFKQKLVISKPFVYELQGYFQISPELKKQSLQAYESGLKCIRLLISYMEEHLAEGDTMELYSCWAEEEDVSSDPSLAKTIHLPDFELGDSFALVDKQFIRVTR